MCAHVTSTEGESCGKSHMSSINVNLISMSTHPKPSKHTTKQSKGGGEKFHLTRVRRTRNFPSNETYARPRRRESLRRPNFESPRNGKRKMRYLAYTKRIQYSEKKRIRTRLSTCKNSCYSSLQSIRFVEK